MYKRQAITDPLGITAQGLKTINSQNSDRILLRELEEIVTEYNVEKIVIGMPLNLKGEKTVRAEKTEKFIHKLKCKFGKMPIEVIDERLTTVQAHKTMNFLDVNKKNKKNIENYAAAMEGAKSLRDITKTSTKAVTAYSKDSLRTYLQNIGSNEKNLRNLSRYLYYRCHAYYRLIAYNANMFCLDARSVIPEYDMVAGVDTNCLLYTSPSPRD